MKSEIKNAEKFSYPKLMKCSQSDVIVCFIKEKYGTIVYPTNATYFMVVCNDWDMEKFVEFNGTIELSN